MILLLAAALQTVTVQRSETIDFTMPQPCAAQTGEEVVVCAKRGESPYRLKQPALPVRKPAKAEMSIADGVTAAAETESADVGGFASNRLMVRLKVKF
mgnify:CR=1 FL=1